MRHPLWGAKADEARGAGHGSMDYIGDYCLITALIATIFECARID